MEIDNKIKVIDEVICRNIDKFDISERGLLSQNILSQLRTFVEHIALKVYLDGKDIDNNNYYGYIKLAIDHIKSRGELKFLSKFHYFLQKSTSHYTPDDGGAKRLMLKYYDYLLKIKMYIKDKYYIDVLANIDKFPINTDRNLKEYYEKIADKINNHRMMYKNNEFNERYYIEKIKPFFVGHEIYYEITFTEAVDRAGKFNRAIAFTKLDIAENYAVKLSINHSKIDILSQSMPILIIDRWEVSIRPCEFNNFFKIFKTYEETKSTHIEYREIMRFLTRTRINLVEFIEFDDDIYNKYKNEIFKQAKTRNIINILDICHALVKNDKSGSNIIRYLLYRLNNMVIRAQIQQESCRKLSDLRLKYECIPFDEMPFCSSPVSHNPKWIDLFDCIDSSNREYELFARYIKNNSEIHGHLYTPIKGIVGFDNIDELIEKYNSSLYRKHQYRRLEKYNDNIYIKSYEEDSKFIIEKLHEISATGIDNYSNSVISWLKLTNYNIDCDEKRKALIKMFENSKVALIYGSAGTGKSTLINHVANFFNDKKKVFLANTHPAIDNLKRKVNAANCTYMTTAKFLAKRFSDTQCDVLLIDECSAMSNKDMREVLEKASFKLLVLVGDIYQIKSIVFGNWFSLSKECIVTTSIFELKKPYRTNDDNLLEFWKRVRNADDTIIEHIVNNKISAQLDEFKFEHIEDDEIILCLNYDGLYGINNLNRFLQESNTNKAVHWGVKTYKRNDPILFNESDRFSPIIYNNLKGKIIGIEIIRDKIQFDIELEKAINQLDAEGQDFVLTGSSECGNSIIRFSVNKYKSTDEDDDAFANNIVPFHIAYAVSIHKAQGLEYDSVKIIITDEIDDLITHNIFYTAITRAKKRLKIYWEAETENKILGSFSTKENKNVDFSILSSKYNLQCTKVL